ncbi:hypothetical protein H4R35_005789 [Dimargaris xerosporica]|nr:hypothetical protein H4R35_005789 [Dimargaris xerosporica]
MVLYRPPDAKPSGQPVPMEDASRPSTIVPFRDQSQGSTWTSFNSQGRVHPTPTGPGILNRLMASCLAFLGKPISPNSSLMSSYARIGHRPSEFLPDKSAQPMEDRLVSEPTVHPTDPRPAHAPQLLLPSPPPNGMSDGGASQQDLSPLGDNLSCSQVHDSVPAAPEQMSGAFVAPSRAQLSPNLSLPMKSDGTHPPNLAHPLDPSHPIPGSASKELAASHYSQRPAAIQEAGPGGQPPAPPPPGPPNPSGVGGPEALSPNSSGPPPPAEKSIGYGSSMFTDRQSCCAPWLEHILAGIRAGGTRYGIVADPSAHLPLRFQQKAHPLRYPELDAILETFARPHFDPIPPAQMQHDSPMAACRPHSPHRSSRSQGLSANDHHPNQAMELGSGDAKLAATPRAPTAGNRQELDSHDPQMFPPFNILPKGTTVELLQANGGNVEKKSGWSFGTTVLYTAIENIGPLSVMVSNLMKLEVIRDYVQLISVFFHSINEPLYGTLRLVLQDIPQFLSLNWSETWGKTIVFFVLFSVIGFITVFTFRMTKKSIPDSDVEGLEVETWNMASRRSSRTLNRAIVFIITTLYLPLSKLAIEALVWDDKFWPVDNPYLKSDTPSLPPLGPATEFRGPYDFCYTTTMSATGANLTWLILVLAAFCILAVSFYFPWSVRKVIKDNLPVPKNYNMQGETRQSAIDEHKKALAEDDCPYNCLYNMYYPESAAQKTVVMFHKFIYLLIICLFTKDNCVFRDASRRTMDIVRQSLVAVYGTGLFIMHWRLQPYLAASQNISEFVSRSAQVLTGYLGLVVVTHKSTQTALGITIFVLNVIAGIVILYLTLLQLECFRNFIHRARKRLRVTSALYGMDVVNGLELLRERLWQETWTALLLTCHEFRVPAGEQIAFSESLQRPPYLVQFKGSVAERHLENIRILQHIGAANYYRRVTEPPSPRMLELSRTITSYLVGPDMYYRPPEEQYPTVVTYFGKAYAIPFPFSLVFVYDDDSQVVRVLQTEAELDWYVKCNADPDIIRRKEVRLMIRALEGQEVLRPFQRRPINQPARLSKGLRQTIRRSHRPRFPDLTRSVSSSRLFGSTPSHPYQDLEAGQLRPLTEFTPHIRYTKGYLRIHRVKPSTWQDDYNMNAGFYVQIEYFDGQGVYQPGRTRKVHEKCAISNRRIGLTAEFGMTSQLRALLAANEATIRERYPKVMQIMSLYRQMYQDEFERKRQTLSYGFLIKVFNTPQIPQNALWHYLETHEANPLLKDIAVHHYMDIRFLYQRMHWAAHHQVALFWYLIWDDVYRLNHHIVPAFQTHAHHFSPYYPTSLAYFPMPRERLVGYLDHYGLWNNSGKSGFFHHGFLNRIYCHLSRFVFGEEVPVFQGPNAPVPPLPDQRDASSRHLPG